MLHNKKKIAHAAIFSGHCLLERRAKVHPLSASSPLLKWFSDELSWSDMLNTVILCILNYNNCDSMKATNRGKTREPLLSYGQKSSGLKGSSLSQNFYTRGSPAVISNFQTTWSFPSKDGTLEQHICSLWLVTFHSYCCDFLAISSGIAGICRTHRKSVIRSISTELTR